MTRRAATAAALLLVLAIAAALAAAILLRPAPPERLRLDPARYGALEGWPADDAGPALDALARSCAVFAKYPDDRAIGPAGLAGTAADWRAPCAAIPAERTAAAARAYFEAWFVPFAATNRGQPEGLFTGYYEPELAGSLTPGGRFRVPLHRRPGDLVTVDLGAFRESWKGQRIAGRLDRDRLVPYPDRGAIEAGALAGKKLELLWVDDPVAAFFLHIQGSGRVVLDDGTMRRVGYAAQNGHAYVAIGRELIRRGALTRETVSLQSIRAWLLANPDEAAAVMDLNPSYVFFHFLDGDASVGAQNAPLTTERSLAVDRRYIPLGVPVWLDTRLPADAGVPGAGAPYRRLMVAQDTGGAIRGPVRGDVFFGPGARAEALAGHMKSPGRYWLLLPRAVAERGVPAAFAR